jgi:hypothetical protein
MARAFTFMTLAFLTAATAACSKSDQVTEIGPTDKPASSHSKAETPDKVVIRFLEAARTGDQKRLAEFMTAAAREQTAKHSINFELEAYQNASFEVGKFEFLTPEKDTAHVACKWTDRDADGATFSHDVLWVLRKEDEGWRVAGMITRPFPDLPPVAFNYESFPELMEAKRAVEQEYQRRDASSQAGKQPEIKPVENKTAGIKGLLNK